MSRDLYTAAAGAVTAVVGIRYSLSVYKASRKPASYGGSVRIIVGTFCELTVFSVRIIHNSVPHQIEILRVHCPIVPYRAVFRGGGVDGFNPLPPPNIGKYFAMLNILEPEVPVASMNNFEANFFSRRKGREQEWGC